VSHGLSQASHQLITRGPVVEVILQHHPRAVQALTRIGLVPHSEQTRLLVDTGAAHTVVDGQVLQQLGLDPIGTAPLWGIGGIVPDCLMYLARLRIKTKNGVMVLDTVVMGVPRFLPASIPFQGLLGRSSLQRTRFRYDGDEGTFDLQKV
jgi:predicted aspartyl protease